MTSEPVASAPQDISDETANPWVADEVDTPQDEISLSLLSLKDALMEARKRLLDRSLRNKLIHTNLESARARQVRLWDVEADQLFALIRSGRPATLIPQGPGKTLPSARDQSGGQLDSAQSSLITGDGENDQGKRPATKLHTRNTAEVLERRLSSLFYEGQTVEEEQGVSVLYLAIGFLEWRESKASEIPRFAPLILYPVELVRSGATDRFKLQQRQDDLFANVSLQAWMKEQFSVEIPDLPEDDDWTPSAYFSSVRAAVGERPGWKLHPNESVLGFFSFSKFLLWRDLDPKNWPNPDGLIDNPLLKRVLLRSDEERADLDVPIIGDDECLDEVFRVADLVHVADADSSQAIAIQEVMAGKDLRIQGPPGTGKSQTITNIIAGAVKRGKKVLFIAEKMAALEVVHRRLVDRKLGPICLELHSRKAAKTQVLEQIKQARAAAAPPRWSERTFSELEELQGTLRSHSNRLHDSHGLAFTPFEVLGAISRIKGAGAPTPTFKLPEAASWSKEQFEDVARRAKSLGEKLGLSGVPANHPWRGMEGPPPNALEQDRQKPIARSAASVADRLQEIASEAERLLVPNSTASLGNFDTWSAALSHIAARPKGVDQVLADERLPSRLAVLRALADEGDRLNETKKRLALVVRSEAQGMDWADVRRILAGQGNSLFRMLSGKYRTAVADLRGVWIGRFPKEHKRRLSTLDDLIDTKQTAASINAAGSEFAPILGGAWRATETDWLLVRSIVDWIEGSQRFEPEIELRAKARFGDAATATRVARDLRVAKVHLTSALDAVGNAFSMNEHVVFDGKDRETVEITELVTITHRWRDRFGDIVQWPPIKDGLDWLDSIGAEELADQVFDGVIPASKVEGVILLAAYEAKWNRHCQADPGLAGPSGDELHRAVERFRRADLDRISMASDEVARSHLDLRPTGSAGAVGVILDELNKTRKLKPVRRLVEEAGEAIQRFKPVFLMSPLSVAQYLPPGQIEFDLLVIDEASQVRPEDALGAIARCRQLVVVGDSQQLPPTNFFNNMVNDDYEEEDQEPTDGRPGRASVKGVESILNLCSRFPERMLRWHYRSEHPALIATSNRRFYRDQLMLPPSVLTGASDGATGLLFHQVASGGYDRGKARRNEIEAQEVANAVLAHALQTPNLTLGIGTFSMAQRDAVREFVNNLAIKQPELDRFISKKDDSGREIFFVKNLENIQGDERDVIFISVGYGHDKDGRLIQNFGPVGRDNGERRLNVLITRAKKRCEVFSSILAEDIKFDENPKPGVVALREFLKLAKDGFIDLPLKTGKSFDSDFEEAVADQIRLLGYDFHPQVGMAGFFIDLGVLDPRDPSRYVLGVECDGAAYHSSRYARDRDRLRQSILESRGWRIHRIWSTDWLYRNEREIEKLKLAIEAAVAGAPLPTAANVYDGEPSFTPVEPEYFEVAEGPANELVGPAKEALPPYKFADFELSYSRPDQLSAQMLADIVDRIVVVEQPIHTDEVARRLAHVCGLQRAGSRIQEAALIGLGKSRRQGRLECKDDFWSESPPRPISPRDRSRLDPGESVRKPDLISLPELAAAAELVLNQNLALTRADLITETARLIGFSRTGKDVAERIGLAIDCELAGRIEIDHLGRVRLLTPLT